MHQITRKELVRLNYGYVFDFLRNNEAFLYEPIDQVRGANQRRNEIDVVVQCKAVTYLNIFHNST